MDLTKDFLTKVLKTANLEDRYVSVLVSRIDMYQTAFTSPLVDSMNNYELYEILGDSTANEALVWYFHGRFSQLRKPSCVKTLARLKIKYSSSDTYSSFAEKLGFWPYIKASDEEKYSKEKKQKLLEDVFEAFIGVTKLISIEKFNYMGVGNQIVYNIIESLLINEDVPLSDEDLHDAKTRLKEFFDKASTQTRFGRVVYTTKDGDSENTRYTILSFVKNNISTVISKGYGITKIAQEKDAASKALDYLKNIGENVAKKPKLLCE